MPREIENEYQKSISRELFERTPKAVFAALAISYYLNTGSENLDAALLDEWKILHEQGIIPQKPPNIARTGQVESSASQSDSTPQQLSARQVLSQPATCQ